jgi:ribonuclease T1
MGSRKRITLALVGLVALVVVGWFVRDAVSPSGLETKPLSSLPKEATTTWRLIEKGGPFPSNRDGVVYENREKILPTKNTGYYHEYTVITPGSQDRGERRLVHGQQRELYYTGDHYKSFVRVDPEK